MKKVMLVLISAALLSACMSGGGSTPVADRPVAQPNAGVGRLLNAERTSRGLAPVKRSVQLQKAAQLHARDMATRGYFAHVSPSGSTPAQRARAQGYGYCTIAENIAAGQQNAAAVMNSWMNSAGHRRNNLNREVRDFGLGHVANGNIWVLMLGRAGC